MKILFYTRKDLLVNSGGDTIQVLKTKEYLKKIGIEADLFADGHNKTGDYDIVHIFNSIPIRHVYDFIKKNRINKLAFSPIYWNLDEFREKVLDRNFLKRKIFNRLNKIPFVNFITSSHPVSKLIGKTTTAVFEDLLQYSLNAADVILPNSSLEAEYLKNKFNFCGKVFIIPNGVDDNIDSAPFDLLKKKYNLPDNFILCAGRIEYRKNQLELLKAAKELGFNVVLAGKVNNKEKKYFRQLHDFSFLHISGMPQNELFGLYSGCRAHVLPSWFETPGLSSLEAAFCGAQIVTTDRGCTKEYFGDNAFYCNPEDYKSITNAIKNSMEHPKDPDLLTDLIKNNYTWKITAEKTLKAYNSIL